MLILEPREAKFLRYGILLACQAYRKDGLAVPPALAALRDQLARAVTSGLELSPVEPVPVVADPVAVDVLEAARRLSISESTARRMVADGRLPAVRVGRRVLIPVAAISRLVEGEAA